MYHEDIILIEGLRKGDISAFEQLFRTYYEKLCLFANRYLDNLAASEEVVSDIYAALWEKRATLVVSNSFRSYIYRAVRNRCLNHLKHQRVEKAYVDYLRQDQILAEDGTIDAAKEEELAREVEDAIEGLPTRCRQIFKMSRYDQLTYMEIANRLELSPKTVERQMMIALEKLRHQLRHLLISE